MNLGNRNTRFYHLTMITRRRRNKVTVLKLQNAEWCTEFSALKKHAVQYYRDSFSKENMNNSTVSSQHLHHSHYTLSDAEQLNLLQLVEFWETTKAVKSMKAHKFAGPDGYQPYFFQRYWEIVGQSVHKLVAKAFFTGKFDGKINETLIVLVPKTDQLVGLKYFSSISLCNVTYKIITKVLVNRMKPILSKLIHPLQASFVPGQQATDNIIIVQEMIDSIRKSKARHRSLMLKLDLEKAYNKVNWEFLIQTLHIFKFPQETINLIHNCISSATFTVM